VLVDPINFTKYDRTNVELEAVAIFSVLVAGKSALPTARALHKLIRHCNRIRRTKYRSPYKAIGQLGVWDIGLEMKLCGIGCYKLKSLAVHELIHNGPADLRTCTVEELETVHGIGPKTARLFLLHTRPNQRFAALDVHILHYLSDLGHDVPRNTPGSPRRYAAIERICLQLADAAGVSPADWDLTIWNRYRERRNATRRPRVQETGQRRQAVA
jgi:hypothetical protein